MDEFGALFGFWRVAGWRSRFGGHKQVEAMITQHARLARSLGDELRLPPDALDALGGSYERWDGKGWPGEREGEQIPLAARVIQLAEFVEVAHRDHGIDGAVQAAEHGSPTQFDPNLVAMVQADAEKTFHGLDEVSSWEPVPDAEPTLRVLSAAELDEALTAIARFVDLKSPFTLGHAQAVATLARDAAACLGLPAGERTVLYRAGLTAGLGRLGVSNGIWDKPGPLTVAEWERAATPALGASIQKPWPRSSPLPVIASRAGGRTPPVLLPEKSKYCASPCAA